MSLLIPYGRADFESFERFRASIDFNNLTRSRAQVLRRVARRHERNLGELFEAGVVTEAQFLQAVEFEEELSVFIEIGLRPDGLTQTV